MQIPHTDAELLADCKVLKARGLVPIAIDGRDAYPFGLWWNVMVERYSGTNQTLRDALVRTSTYQDPAILKAAIEMQEWVRKGVFGPDFLNQDYGAARNLFGQGKAAMLMQGEWEGGMAEDRNLPESVRNAMGAFNFPVVTGGKGSQTDLISWYGSAWGISSRSAHVQEARDFLYWMFQPGHWPKQVIEQGAAFPAQKIPEGTSPSAGNALGASLFNIYRLANPNAPYIYTPQFTADGYIQSNNAMMQLVSLKITPQEFVNEMDRIAEQSWKVQQAHKD